MVLKQPACPHHQASHSATLSFVLRVFVQSLFNASSFSLCLPAWCNSCVMSDWCIIGIVCRMLGELQSSNLQPFWQHITGREVQLQLRAAVHRHPHIHTDPIWHWVITESDPGDLFRPIKLLICMLTTEAHPSLPPARPLIPPAAMWHWHNGTCAAGIPKPPPPSFLAFVCPGGWSAKEFIKSRGQTINMPHANMHKHLPQGQKDS